MAAPLKVGDYVFIRDDMWCRYGQVTAIADAYSCKDMGMRPYYRVHYIVPATGRLQDCPDRQRCNNTGGCPIHGCSRQAAGLIRFSDADIALFRQEGMLRN